MVSGLSIVFMVISAIISIGLPIGLFLVFRKKYHFKVVPMLVGAAAFIVFALVLEQQMHMLVLRPGADGSIALRNNPLLYVLYGAFAAGIFEETARFISFKLLKNRYGGIETGLSYGIGHGGIESVILAGLSMISAIALSAMINAGASEVLGNTPQVAAQIATLTQTPPYMFLVSAFERICAVTIQISLSVLVWYAATMKAKWWLFPAAIVFHAAIDVPATLMQCGVIQSVFLVEALAFVCALALAALAVFVHKKLKQGEALAADDS